MKAGTVILLGLGGFLAYKLFSKKSSKLGESSTQPVVWKNGQPQPPMIQPMVQPIESHPNWSPEQVRLHIFFINQDIDSKKKEISLLESFRTNLPSVDIVEKYFGDFPIELKTVSVEGPNAGTHVLIYPDWMKDKLAFIKKNWFNYVNGKMDDFYFGRIGFDDVLKTKKDELATFSQKPLNDILSQYPPSVTTVTPENAKSDIDYINNLLKNITSAYTGKNPTQQEEEGFKSKINDYLNYLLIVSTVSPAQKTTPPTPPIPDSTAPTPHTPLHPAVKAGLVAGGLFLLSSLGKK